MASSVRKMDEEELRRFRIYVAEAVGPPLTKEKLQALETNHPDVNWRQWLGLPKEADHARG